MSMRAGTIGLLLAALLSLGSPAAGENAARLARAARPSDLKPVPLPCTAKNAKPTFCVLTSVVATVHITPHVVRPGHVIRGYIEKFSCTDIPFTTPCPVKWGPTGKEAIMGTLATFLKPITRCGKQDHECRWRVSKHAPTMRYDLLGVEIYRSQAVEGAEDFSALTNDYVGILGPKPPPPTPKRSTEGPTEPIVPILPPPLPHH